MDPNWPTIRSSERALESRWLLQTCIPVGPQRLLRASLTLHRSKKENLIAAASRHPGRFGIIAFGIIGLIYGILQTAPWTPSDAILLRSLFAKLAWSLVFAGAAALFGWRIGKHFVETARSRRFARAAALVIPGLFFAALVFSLVYFIAIVSIGDFGQSQGIFGSFEPTTLTQKLMGAIMVALVQLLSMAASSVLVGFAAGYVLALMFDEDWKDE
jgi:hypothetical protein